MLGLLGTVFSRLLKQQNLDKGVVWRVDLFDALVVLVFWSVLFVFLCCFVVV